MRVPLAVTMLCAALVAGCLEHEALPAAGDAGQAIETLPVAVPLPDGQGARDLIASYVMTHPFRVDDPEFQPYMDKARDDLEALLASFGQTVVRQEYDGGINLLAVQEGTSHPEQWVVLSAHYDSVGIERSVPPGIGPTVYGAWDDGAGVALLLQMAKDFAAVEFPFTLVYAFFDGEEKGLVGSKRFVEHYFEDGTHDLVANINTDPPGLNWPCGDATGPFAVKIIHDSDGLGEGKPRHLWLRDAFERALNETGVPHQVRDYSPVIPVASVMGAGLGGGSDHESFREAGIANVYLGGVPLVLVNGNPDEHTLGVMGYGVHTPLDTLQQMEARCTQGSVPEAMAVIGAVFARTLERLANTAVPDS